MSSSTWRGLKRPSTDADDQRPQKLQPVERMMLGSQRQIIMDQIRTGNVLEIEDLLSEVANIDPVFRQRLKPTEYNDGSPSTWTLMVGAKIAIPLAHLDQLADYALENSTVRERIIEFARAPTSVSFKPATKLVKYALGWVGDTPHRCSNWDSSKILPKEVIAGRILEIVQTKVMDKVTTKYASFETKQDALIALVDIASAIGTSQYREDFDSPQWAPEIAKARVPQNICRCMVKIHGMMTKSEIKIIIKDRKFRDSSSRFLPKLDSLKGQHLCGHHSNSDFYINPAWGGEDNVWDDLRTVRDLFVDNEKRKRFISCVLEVQACLERIPWDPSSSMPYTGLHVDDRHIRFCFELCIHDRILSKLNPKSCFKTQQNALRALINLGDIVVQARNDGTHVTAFADYHLDRMVTDAMREAINIIKEGDCIQHCLDGRPFKRLKDLDSSRGRSLPGLVGVLKLYRALAGFGTRVL